MHCHGGSKFGDRQLTQSARMERVRLLLGWQFLLGPGYQRYRQPGSQYIGHGLEARLEHRVRGSPRHLEDDPPGSSPPGVIYWFSGTLIYLTAQLTRPGVVAEKIVEIVQSRQARGARNAISANLRHTSTTVWPRYPASYLDTIEKQVLETHERQKVLERRHAKEMLEAVKKHNPRA